MQNLDQIRAATAEKLCKPAVESFKRNDVAGIPALIIANGLLAATAFADEEGKESRKGMKTVMNGVANHLANPVHGIVVLAGKISSKSMMSALSGAGATSLDLQRATSEALAFLAYVKRFATKN